MAAYCTPLIPCLFLPLHTLSRLYTLSRLHTHRAPRSCARSQVSFDDAVYIADELRRLEDGRPRTLQRKLRLPPPPKPSATSPPIRFHGGAPQGLCRAAQTPSSPTRTLTPSRLRRTSPEKGGGGTDDDVPLASHLVPSGKPSRYRRPAGWRALEKGVVAATPDML